MYSDVTRIWVGKGYVNIERTQGDTGALVDRRYKLTDRRIHRIEGEIARASFKGRIWLGDLVTSSCDLFVHLNVKERD